MEYEKIIEELNVQLDKAGAEFIYAKQEAIKALENMHIHQAVDFGAAYCTHIDKVTKAAAEYTKIGELLEFTKYMQAQQEQQEV